MNKILIPTDFSDASINSIFYGLTMGENRSIQFILIHVIELYKYAAGTSESEIYTELSKKDRAASFTKNAEEAFKKLTDEINQRFPSHPPIETKIVSGTLINEIHKAADREEVFMIIISGPNKRLKNQSASNHYSIINKIKHPIMIIPRQAIPKVPGRLLYASSIVESDVKAISLLSSYAEKLNSEVLVLHVIQKENDFYQELIFKGFTRILSENISYPKIKYISHSDKKVIKGIETVAKTEGADLLVMMKKRRSLLTSIINKNNTEQLVFSGNIPLLYYPESLLK
jgi:nucleotide-binding universal stress UspA family protein